jgi:hypothetical protein
MGNRGRWGVARISDARGTVLAEWVLQGPGHPGLRAVDVIARLALMARRRGAVLTVAEASAELCQLLELCGLPVDVQRQAESGEEALRVNEGQEEAHNGDLPP